MYGKKKCRYSDVFDGVKSLHQFTLCYSIWHLDTIESYIVPVLPYS